MAGSGRDECVWTFLLSQSSSIGHSNQKLLNDRQHTVARRRKRARNRKFNKASSNSAEEENYANSPEAKQSRQKKCLCRGARNKCYLLAAFPFCSAQCVLFVHFASQLENSRSRFILLCFFYSLSPSPSLSTSTSSTFFSSFIFLPSYFAFFCVCGVW